MTLDWQDKTDLIQQLYFKTGKGAYLWIACDASNGNVSWGFNMLDLGMCHTIAGCSQVHLSLPEMNYYVNGSPVGQQELLAWNAVFGGHYQKFLEEIGQDVGFSLTLVSARL